MARGHEQDRLYRAVDEHATNAANGELCEVE